MAPDPASPLPPDRVIPVLAVAIGFGIILQGLFGLSMPDPFLGLVGAFQVPPVLYIAATIRIAVGLILVFAAPMSRAPIALRVVGWLIFAGGVLTPIMGHAFAESMIAWWRASGRPVVRAGAAMALLLGSFIVYANFPRAREPAGPHGSTPID